MPGWEEIEERLSGSVFDIAPRLLGCLISHDGVSVRITEVEAYGGSDDPGSHAYRGPTPRTASMFGPPGHLYCYLSYGVHVCANVTVGAQGAPGAVLLRAGEVQAGEHLAHQRAPSRSRRDLARGPGRLCQVQGIDLSHDGTDLSRGPVTLSPGPFLDSDAIGHGPRVGLRAAAERPWRFWISGETTVSTYRRHPRAAGPTR